MFMSWIVAHLRQTLQERGWNLEIEIAIDIGVEIKLTALDQLHYCRPSEELGYRRHAKQCLVGDGGCVLVQKLFRLDRIGHDESVLPDGRTALREIIPIYTYPRVSSLDS